MSIRFCGHFYDDAYYTFFIILMYVHTYLSRIYVCFIPAKKKNNIPQNGTKLDRFRNDEMINELDILKKV